MSKIWKDSVIEKFAISRREVCSFPPHFYTADILLCDGPHSRLILVTGPIPTLPSAHPFFFPFAELHRLLPILAELQVAVDESSIGKSYTPSRRSRCRVLTRSEFRFSLHVIFLTISKFLELCVCDRYQFFISVL